MTERITAKLPKRRIETLAGLVLAVAAAACAGGEGKEGVLGVSTPSASPERPVPTKTAESTVLPTPTATVRPTSTREVPRTPTPEAKRAKEGIFDLRTWQVGIKSWEELPSNREGWKKVLVQAMARNMTGGILSTRSLNYDYFTWSINAEGFLYQGSNYIYTEYGGFVTSPPNFVGGGLGFVPPGFAIPIGIVAEVPQNRESYTLAVASARRDVVLTAQELKRSQMAIDFPQISSEVKIKNPDEPWVLPNYAKVYFNRVFTVDVKYLNIIQEQFVSFDFQNDYGQDIRTDYGNINVTIFLKDGRVIPGDEYSYSDKVSRVKIVPPGLRKTVDVNIAGTSRQSGYISGEILDVKGAVIVLFFNNQWAAWRVE